jgi:nucleotide-binding universal stress UspA family protein
LGARLKVLVPVDGSKPSERALGYAIKLSRSGLRLEVLLLNVQPEWAPARSREEKRAGVMLQIKAGEEATRAAVRVLEQAKIAYMRRTRVGPAADTILNVARRNRSDLIIMGRRGLGAVAGLLLGSVSMKVVQLADIPVTLVK